MPCAEQEREQHALGTEGKLLHRQEQELKALRKRITSGAEEQRQARQQDLERLLQRYYNPPRSNPDPSARPSASRSSARTKTQPAAPSPNTLPLTRYHNVKSELESQQHTERIRSSKVG